MRIKRVDWKNEGEIDILAYMFKDCITELFPSLATTNILAYYAEVFTWKNFDVYITYDKEITGFVCGHVLPNSFCKSHYFIEHIYVKKEHRKTKAAYMLYNAVIERGDSLNLITIGNAYIDTVKGMYRFGKPLFTQIIREANNGRK